MISSITRDTIPEETFGNNMGSLGRRPSWFIQSVPNRRPSVQRQQTISSALMQQSSPSNSDSDSSTVDDEDVECLMKIL